MGCCCCPIISIIFIISVVSIYSQCSTAFPSLNLVPCSDFWVLDSQVVLWNHFGGDGSWVGEERCDDPAIAKLCASSFDAAWDRAIPHETYRPA